jgi:hypothetical protein
MHRRRPWSDEAEEDANRQTASLGGVAVVLLLLVVGLFLVQTLRREAALEDCLMAGRLSCGHFAQSISLAPGPH